MSNFTPTQVYERVPFHFMVSDSVLIMGTFRAATQIRSKSLKVAG